MKKILGLGLVILLAASTASAVEKKGSKSDVKKTEKSSTMKSPVDMAKNFWSIQVSGDLNFMTQDTTSSSVSFTTGYGYEVGFAYNLGEHVALGFLTGAHKADAQDVPSTVTADWTYTPMEVYFKYSFSGPIRSFALLGMGVATNSLNFHADAFSITETISETGFIISPGVGVSFELSDQADLFIQTRLDLIPMSDDWKTGFMFTNIGDSLFIPFQVGLNFHSI